MKAVALVLILCCICAAFKINPDEYNELRALVKERYPRLSDQDVDEFTKLLFYHYQEMQEEANTTTFHQLEATPVPFQCTPIGPSPTVPTSVHKLRPSDVKVVAALGDSITAAFGAKAGSIFTVFTEYRGVSWSIGGDSDVSQSLTMPNILKKFSPNLKGFSVKTGKETSANSRFNVAVTGAIVQDLPAQADNLIKKLQQATDVSFNEDWKVVTVFIGGNNLCEYCNDRNTHSPDIYEQDLRQTMQKLKTIPRVYVNLVLVIDVSKLYAVSSGFCSLLHTYECPCGTSDDAKVREEVTNIASQYNERARKISEEAEFANDDDFTIVIQPFMVETQVPLKTGGDPDKAYFAPDCFHFSYLAHEAAAVALWDNMVEPVGEKRTKWTIGEPIECPDEQHPYLYTNQNSKQKEKQ